MALPSEDSRLDSDFLLWLADRCEFVRHEKFRAEQLRQVANRSARGEVTESDVDILTKVRSMLVDNYGERRSDTWIERIGDVIYKILEGKRLVAVKPPLGLVPKKQHDLDRCKQIVDAMSRYIAEGKDVPPSWIQELNERMA